MPMRLLFFVFLVCLSRFVGEASAQTCNYSSIVATAPTSRFSDNGDGTVRDLATGLQWKRCSEGQTWSWGTCIGDASKHTWQEALQLAEVASYVNQNDWRLPNYKELFSIIEMACYGPRIDLNVFPATLSDTYWTSSPDRYYGGGAMGVDFSENQYSTAPFKESRIPVRLVRGGI
jgi:hypothetical protein